MLRLRQMGAKGARLPTTWTIFKTDGMKRSASLAS